MTQDKVSKYKRVVMFLIGIVILGANTAIFGYPFTAGETGW